MRRILIVVLMILLTACSSTLNVGEYDQPAYTTKIIVYEGVTWHGEYYNDRWNWTRVD